MDFKRKFADYLLDKEELHRSPVDKRSAAVGADTTQVEPSGQGPLILNVFQRGEIKAVSAKPRVLCPPYCQRFILLLSENCRDLDEKFKEVP